MQREMEDKRSSRVQIEPGELQYRRQKKEQQLPGSKQQLHRGIIPELRLESMIGTSPKGRGLDQPKLLGLPPRFMRSYKAEKPIEWPTCEARGTPSFPRISW